MINDFISYHNLKDHVHYLYITVIFGKSNDIDYDFGLDKMYLKIGYLFWHFGLFYNILEQEHKSLANKDDIKHKECDREPDFCFFSD